MTKTNSINYWHQKYLQENSKNKQLIDKALEWIRYYNNNGGCLFDGWEDDFKKHVEKSTPCG